MCGGVGVCVDIYGCVYVCMCVYAYASVHDMRARVRMCTGV